MIILIFLISKLLRMLYCHWSSLKYACHLSVQSHSIVTPSARAHKYSVSEAIYEVLLELCTLERIRMRSRVSIDFIHGTV